MKYEALLSENVDQEAGYASDVGSCFRRIEKTPEVEGLKGNIDPQELCLCLKRWMEEPYNRRYRHPKESALCAGLVLLTDCLGAPGVKDLLVYISKITEPALSYVCLFAEYVQAR